MKIETPSSWKWGRALKVSAGVDAPRRIRRFTWDRWRWDHCDVGYSKLRIYAWGLIIVLEWVWWDKE